MEWYTVLRNCKKLRRIEVTEGNPVYMYVNGMLLDKKKGMLIFVQKNIKGNIQIPEDVTEIGWRAFEGCTGLTSIIMPEGITEIEDHAFIGCTGLKSITIPKSVTTIGRSAFEDCKGLVELDVSEENPVYKSVNGMLLNKKGTEVIFAPEGITGDIQIPNGVTKIGGRAFWKCGGLTSITIPKGVTEIGRSAFEWCTGLTSITIPEGVRKIRDCAFFLCTRLKSITIPKSVMRIEEAAFNYCSIEIYFEGNAPELVGNSFDQVHATVYYRKGTKGWKETFGGIPTKEMP